MTVERLKAFGAAWSAGDVEFLMSCFTDDCVYSASVGPEPGETFVGRDAVRRGIEKMIRHDSDAVGKNGECYVYGDKGFGEWSYVYTVDGKPVEVRGFDMFDFEGDRIKRKDGFRKTSHG